METSIGAGSTLKIIRKETHSSHSATVLWASSCHLNHCSVFWASCLPLVFIQVCLTNNREALKNASQIMPGSFSKLCCFSSDFGWHSHLSSGILGPMGICPCLPFSLLCFFCFQWFSPAFPTEHRTVATFIPLEAGTCHTCLPSEISRLDPSPWRCIPQDIAQLITFTTLF